MSVQAHKWAHAKAIALGLLARAADWDESLHPRDERGRFGHGGGGDSGTTTGPREPKAPKGNGKPATNLSTVAQKYKDKPPAAIGPVNVEVYRRGPIEDRGRGVFFGQSPKAVEGYQTSHPIQKYRVEATSAFIAKDHATLHSHLFKESFLEAIEEEGNTVAAVRMIESAMADELRSLGHDALVYTNTLQTGEPEIGVLANSAKIIPAEGEVPEQRSPETKPEAPHLDPVVTETSGGQWSRATAIRLEAEYQAALPRLEALTPEDGLPKEFDPLNQSTDADFERTQSLAHYLSVLRASEIITERGIAEPTDAALANAHTKLWTAWSDSSSTTDGQLLQVAVSEELGGRLRTGRNSPIDTDQLKSYANKQYKELGGYEGVKGYVRAKWEVTQYLLDKAGIKELQLFRSIDFSPEQLATATEEPQGKFTKLPGVAVVRNGAASTSVDPKVANKWGKSDTRVVLRALVPRTAAVSLPVYGLLPEDLKEVVVAGTAWKAWDAWRGEAPDFKTHPMEWSP